MGQKRYVGLDAKVLEHFMAECGFSPTVQGNEVVYLRSNAKHPCVQVKVYSSVQAGHAVARGCGRDAIRVVAAYVGPQAFPKAYGKSTNFGIFKTPKILRVGSEEAILGRLLQRMREAYKATNQWLQDNWSIVTSIAPLTPTTHKVKACSRQEHDEIRKSYSSFVARTNPRGEMPDDQLILGNCKVCDSTLAIQMQRRNDDMRVMEGEACEA